MSDFTKARKQVWLKEVLTRALRSGILELSGVDYYQRLVEEA